MALNSIFESSSSERRWINQISKMLEKEVRIEINDVPVSIFRVPTTLSSFKPEAYTPQLIGLGPYHHFRPELYEMERYKIAAASRVQNQFQSLEFKQLVHKLNEIEYKVRASYHKYLDIDGETLAWIMAIDGLFLLDFLNSYVNKKDSLSSLSTTAFLVDGSGKKLANDAILGDIVMLENQMPIFLLSEILTIQSSLPDLGKNLLPPMLMGFCKAVSPLKLKEDLPLSQVFEHAHLLDLLYHLTVPKLEEHHKTDNGEKGGASLGGKTGTDSGNSINVFTKLWSSLSKVNVGFVSKITKPINVIIGLPWKYITSLPGISTFTSKAKENIKLDRENLSGQEMKGPLVEEIMIPSVSYLFDAGVKFYPTEGDITTIKFDQKTKTFYLPVIILNVNSEVIMRNLVAYEASIASESLVLARYTELLNGIIDTDKDAKLLREKKIIINSLKSDADVAEIFNGMSKSVRLTNVSFIDEAIDGVNKYFYNTKKVRTYNRMKKYVYSSWKILTLIAVIMLIVLMSLESFCSVYDCTRFYGTSS
ncbi:putative UPF0481 protein At3g02645 [Actinidia eriantha]|uniref:putative UPF0481 protein At3g02645 n=1 Tax=Actinidia eriantha TaxID=165200 RepID=UPI00258603D4|nr:putative UPF0481 protein At3g02645 [Actinidia eriantha]